MRWRMAVVAILFPCLAFADWRIPNTPENGIGDPGNFYITNPGVTFDLLNDDYIGSTDKLMTGSNFISLQWVSGKDWGFEFSVNHRFLNPITKTRFHNGEIINSPQGFYGDELEPRFSISRLSGWFKTELSLGVAIYGDFGGASAHDTIHKAVDSPLELHRFGDLPHGAYLVGSAGAGFLLNNNLLWMFYVNRSPTMDSYTSRFSLKTDLWQGAAAAMQVQADYMHRSHFYQKLVPWHWGVGWSFKWGFYQFTANYSSIYLQYDRYGQFFLSPLILNFEF